MSPFDEEYVIHKIIEDLGFLKTSVDNIRMDLAGLKVKAGVWGLAAGLIPAIGAILIYLSTKP